MDNKQQILVLHWWDTFKNYEEFFESLQNKEIDLERFETQKDRKTELQRQLWDNYIVYTPQFPNKQNAQYIERKILFEKILNQLNENIILIWHSLWAAFIVKYLSENNINKKIKQTYLLWTPYDDNIDSDYLFSFKREWDINNLVKQAWELFFYHSKDDFVVPFEDLESFQKILPNVNYRIFDDRNHFLQSEIPELINDIKS